MTYSDQFENCWSLYPRKIGKSLAYKKFNQALKRTDYATIVNAIAGYAAYTRNTEPRFICHFSTWLGQDRWLDNYTALTADQLRKSATSFSMVKAAQIVQENSTQVEREETDLGELFAIHAS